MKMDQLIDKKKLKHPDFWFVKAHAYASACLFILEEFSRAIKDKDGENRTRLKEVTLSLSSVGATPYLVGISSELYMKGYLISKGEKPDALKRVGHNLKTIREKCATFGDPRFNDKDLIFLADTLGKYLMEDGGVRYPDKNDLPIYIPIFKNILNMFHK